MIRCVDLDVAGIIRTMGKTLNQRVFPTTPVSLLVILPGFIVEVVSKLLGVCRLFHQVLTFGVVMKDMMLCSGYNMFGIASRLLSKPTFSSLFASLFRQKVSLAVNMLEHK